jgi:hypothetical protein
MKNLLLLIFWGIFKNFFLSILSHCCIESEWKKVCGNDQVVSAKYLSRGLFKMAGFKTAAKKNTDIMLDKKARKGPGRFLQRVCWAWQALFKLSAIMKKSDEKKQSKWQESDW